MMKADCAAFLLEAIGEISESTVAEAKQPQAKSPVITFRRPALVAAFVLLAAAAGVLLTLGFYRSGGAPSISPPSESAGIVSMDDAINAAMQSLRETGVKATLTRASLMSNAPQPYYLVKLSAENGSYDCSVDAESGQVLEITYSLPPTETQSNDAVSDEVKNTADPAQSGHSGKAATEAPAPTESVAQSIGDEAPDSLARYNTHDIVPLQERRDLSDSTLDLSQPIDDALRSFMEQQILKEQEEIKKWNEEHKIH